MKAIISALFLIFTVGCASISTGVDTVKNVVATVVDTTVSSAATMATAITEDVVDTGTFVVETGVGVVQIFIIVRSCEIINHLIMVNLS